MVYVVVMGVCGLAVGIAITGVTLAGQRAASSRAAADASRASVKAHDALMDVLRIAKNTASWRASAGSGELMNFKVDDTQVIVTVSDPVDGDLLDSLDEPITVRAEVRHPRVRRLMRMTIEPDSRALPCLGYAIIVGGQIQIDGSKVWANAAIHSNSTIAIKSSTVAATVSASGTITGTGISGGVSSGVPLVPVPAVEDVIGAYREIVRESDQSVGGDFKISNSLVTPSNSMLGGFPGDLAVLNLGARKMTVESSRIAGTIVLTQCGEFKLQQPMLLTPRAGMPALVSGSYFVTNTSDQDFSESGIKANLNPAAWPYLGESDADTSDWYPSEINGVVYIGGDAKLDGKVIINGVLVVRGNLVINSAEVTVRWNELANIPPGFREQPEFRIVPGSITKLVDVP